MIKKLFLKLANWVSRTHRKYKLMKLKPVQDLLMNNHDFCGNCGEIFYKSTPTRKYCSDACRYKYHYIERKK